MSKENMRNEYYLQILSIDGQEEKLLVDGKTYTIGRYDETTSIDIQLPEQFRLVSRPHAKISIRHGKCTFVDLPSNLNGSFLCQVDDVEQADTKDWIRMKKGDPYQITQNKIIRMGGLESIDSNSKVCDIKIKIEEKKAGDPTVPSNRTLPNYEDE